MTWPLGCCQRRCGWDLAAPDGSLLVLCGRNGAPTKGSLPAPALRHRGASHDETPTACLALVVHTTLRPDTRLSATCYSLVLLGLNIAPEIAIATTSPVRRRPCLWARLL